MPKRCERSYICDIIPREVQSLQIHALPNASEVMCSCKACILLLKKNKKNTDILEGLNSDILIKSYQVLSIWGTVLTPNQILLYGTWAAPQLSCHSLHLKESREIRPEQHKAHSLFYSQICNAHSLFVSQRCKSKKCWEHRVCSFYGGTIE